MRLYVPCPLHPHPELLSLRGTTLMASNVACLRFWKVVCRSMTYTPVDDVSCSGGPPKAVWAQANKAWRHSCLGPASGIEGMKNCAS